MAVQRDNHWSADPRPAWCVTAAQLWTHRCDVLAAVEALVGGEEPTEEARLIRRRLLEVGGDTAAVGARGAGQAARRRARALGG